MQRQSLGSPVSKLHIHGGGVAKEDCHPAGVDAKQKNSSVSDDEESKKTTKAGRFSVSPVASTHSKPENLIHLIPLVTILCFFILYLSSHSPSQSDLGQFNGFQPVSKQIDSSEMEEVGRLTELRRGDVLRIRSLRSIEAPKCRPHRKIAAC